MRAPLPLLVVSALVAAACGGKKEQSFEQGVALLCGSTASLPSTMSRSEKANAIAKTADQKVTNKEVRDLAGSLATLEGDQKVEVLRKAAARAKIEHCGLLELWVESPMARSLRTICEAPDKVPPGADPSARAQELADYIQSNVSDPDAIKLMQELAVEEPQLRGAHLLSVAKANGIEYCPLADMK